MFVLIVRVALALLLVRGAEVVSPRLDAVGRTSSAPRAAVRAPAVQRASRLRGGADEALGEDAAGVGSAGASSAGASSAGAGSASEEDGTVQLEDPADDLPADDDSASSASVGCFAMLRQAFSWLVDLLSPKYEYAKVKTDILGDAAQTAGFAANDESWRTQRKKLNVVDLKPDARKRIMRDLRRLKGEGGEALGVEVEDCSCLSDWVIKVVGANGTVFAGEIYRLRVRFLADYPMQPPEVTFMRPAPVHEHIYSDGKICLNILYSDWNPKMDVRSVCLSLISMLSTAKEKKRPPDNNATVVMSRGQRTGGMQWEFHDDNC